MRMRFWIGAMAALTISVGVVSSAGASPLLRADHLATVTASENVILVHHKPGHVMKHANRGRHLGWTRGKHKGWYKHR